MADCKLSDGREIDFDLDKMTVREWREFLESVDVGVEDDLIERCAGLLKGTIADLPYGDLKRLGAAFYKKIREPLADPN